MVPTAQEGPTKWKRRPAAFPSPKRLITIVLSASFSSCCLSFRESCVKSGEKVDFPLRLRNAQTKDARPKKGDIAPSKPPRVRASPEANRPSTALPSRVTPSERSSCHFAVGSAGIACSTLCHGLGQSARNHVEDHLSLATSSSFGRRKTPLTQNPASGPHTQETQRHCQVSPFAPRKQRLSRSERRLSPARFALGCCTHPNSTSFRCFQRKGYGKTKKLLKRKTNPTPPEATSPKLENRHVADQQHRIREIAKAEQRSPADQQPKTPEFTAPHARTQTPIRRRCGF